MCFATAPWNCRADEELKAVLQEAFEARQASTAGSELQEGTLVSGS